jgi:hypothetical protein
MTEVIDLDLVSRVREYGTLGTSQLWKDLGNFKGKFPIYQDDIRKGELFKTLGPLELHGKLKGWFKDEKRFFRPGGDGNRGIPRYWKGNCPPVCRQWCPGCGTFS